MSEVRSKLLKDLVGSKYGKLTVVGYSHREKANTKKIQYRHYWKCNCSCGVSKIMNGSSLKSGNSKSCGCFSRAYRTKHGFLVGLHKENSREIPRFYNIWKGIKQRCTDKNCDNYKRYGGVGIGICKEWINFSCFMEDMYDSYISHHEEFGEKDTSIDRIDNDKGYCKENCRWATCKEQSNNIKKNLVNKDIKYKGGHINLSEFCNKFNLEIKKTNLKLKNGWTPEETIAGKKKIVTKKVKDYLSIVKKYKTNFYKLREKEVLVLSKRYGLDDDQTMTLQEVGNYFGVSRERIRQIEERAMDKLIM